MSNTSLPERDSFISSSVTSYVQFGALVLLLWLCLKIVAPFLNLVMWGMIISIAIYPAYVALTGKLGGRTKIAAILVTLIGIAVILVPAWILADSTISALQGVAADFEDGTVTIPPPSADVAEWPIVGEKLHALWSQAATNLEGVLNRFEPQIKELSQKLLGIAASGAGGVLSLVVAMIIAGALLGQAQASHKLTTSFFSRLLDPARGAAMTDLSIAIIRSVAKGILGIALIQAILSTIGLVVMGIPAAGLWAFAVLVLAIVQLPPILVLGPIAAWAYSFADPVPATIFLVYCLVVSASDAFLKPLLLGRGIELPMLVILIGAIGGAVSMGILGLFLGPVILALGYELLRVWLTDEDPADAIERAGGEQASESS